MTPGSDTGASSRWFHFLGLLIKDQACNISFVRCRWKCDYNHFESLLPTFFSKKINILLFKKKASWHSAFFMVQLLNPYIKKTIALSIWTFVGKIIFLFNMLSRFVIAFLPRSKDLAVGKYLLNRSQKILNLF